MTEHIDMAQFTEAKSDQLNADDLIGAPRTITVTKVRGCEGDQPVAINYEGDNGKPWKPCKTARRILLAVWGRNAADYVGRSLTLFRDDSVTFGGLNVGGIRISHMSDLDKETVVVVMKSKGMQVGIKVQPLKIEQPKQQVGRQTPEQWLEQYKTDVGACQDLTALALLEHNSGKAMAKLERDQPTLHREATDVFNIRRAELEQVQG